MEKETIEKIIRKYVRNNYETHPGAFPNTLTEIAHLSQLLGETYWENRNNIEIQRDIEAEVTQLDYERWCISELMSIKNNQLYN